MKGVTLPTETVFVMEMSPIKFGLGATDEIGLYAVENRVHVHDLHATILHCLGLDHTRLTLMHNGRDERPTINGGKVIREILA